MTVLADSSAWIELLRRTESPLETALRARLQNGEVATTDVVIMEVLAGATGLARTAGIERTLNRCVYLPQRRLVDAKRAAELYRTCRGAGETPRQLTDCLIGAVALRNEVSILQRDRDFDVIARHTAVTVVNS